MLENKGLCVWFMLNGCGRERNAVWVRGALHMSPLLLVLKEVEKKNLFASVDPDPQRVKHVG